MARVLAASGNAVMPTMRCEFGCIPITVATLNEGADLLWQHNAEKHRGITPTPIHQLPTVDWHSQALQAIRALATKGEPFVISQVIEFGVPDAPNPRTDWSRVQKEAENLGWIEQTGRLGRSVRPTTKGSPVAEWRGTYAMTRRHVA